MKGSPLGFKRLTGMQFDYFIAKTKASDRSHVIAPHTNTSQIPVVQNPLRHTHTNNTNRMILADSWQQCYLTGEPHTVSHMTASFLHPLVLLRMDHNGRVEQASCTTNLCIRCPHSMSVDTVVAHVSFLPCPSALYYFPSETCVADSRSATHCSCS